MQNTIRTLVIALAVLVVALLAFSMLMGGMMGPGMMTFGTTGPGLMARGWTWGLGMGVGGLAMLAFWGALIVGVVLVARSLGGGQGGRGDAAPLDIAKRRYAAGEITRDQYEQLRKDLAD
jgi:putative membrane protein